MRVNSKKRDMKKPHIKLKTDYTEGTKTVLNASQREQCPYATKVLGKTFMVNTNVFSPKYFHDTEFFAKHIAIKHGEKFLEIGPGTGVISVFAALRGAKRVVAIDINPDAVQNTKENSRRHRVSKIVKVFQGDVYSPLRPNDKFDTIFWNVPFAYSDQTTNSNLEKAIIDPKYRSLKMFVKDSKKYLNPGGKLLIGFSTTLGHISLLKRFVKEGGFKLRLLKEIRSKETYPVKFQLFEAKLS